MNLSEFKAWLDGYLDGKDGLTAEQVAAVQAKMALVMTDWGTGPARMPPSPNIIGPYWSPAIPTTADRWQPPIPVTCTTAGDWLKSATLCNTEQ